MRFTFWKLITNYKIEIPVIQRDYALGRNNDKVKRIKKNFINDILSSLIDNKTMNLDFIYGKIENKKGSKEYENKKIIVEQLISNIKMISEDVDVIYEIKKDEKDNKNEKFIPLDGQQRLTTLFLIHWYLAFRLNDYDKTKKDILNNFSYSTRISSRDFCKFLVNDLFDQNKTTTFGQHFSDVIIDNPNFFKFWQNDPTVKSMLSVIDEIHTKFNPCEFQFNNFWKYLTEDDNEFVTFDFFDLEDYKQTDELYVTMNSRGKALTDFENFKSWLFEKLDENFKNNYQKKFDIDWYDLFWKNRDNSSQDVDNEYLQIFKLLLLGDYIKIMTENVDKESKKNPFSKDSSIDLLRKKDKGNPINLFQDNFKQINFEDYFKILDILKTENIANEYIFLEKYVKLRDSDNEDDIDEKTGVRKLSEVFFSNRNSDLTWWEITLFYASTRYLLKVNNCYIHFEDWLRIISNLIYNTRIEGKEDFLNAVKSLDTVIEDLDKKNVYEYFSGKKKIEFFNYDDNRQLKEENIKSKKIFDDNEWKQIINEAENHNYFYGQIGWIFELVKQFKEETSDTKLNDKEIFLEIFNKVSVLFSEEVLEENNLLLKLFLSYPCCQPFRESSENIDFHKNTRVFVRSRDENWRNVFESEVGRMTIMKIIENKNFNTNCIIDSIIKITEENLTLYKCKYGVLKKIIFYNNYSFDIIFEYMKGYRIRIYKDNTYYILGSTQTNGYFAEMFTYNYFKLYLENNKGFFKYDFVRGIQNKPGIIFKYHDICYKLYYHDSFKIEKESLDNKLNNIESFHIFHFYKYKQEIKKYLLNLKDVDCNTQEIKDE